MASAKQRERKRKLRQLHTKHGRAAQCATGGLVRSAVLFELLFEPPGEAVHYVTKSVAQKVSEKLTGRGHCPVCHKRQKLNTAGMVGKHGDCEGAGQPPSAH